MVISYNWIKDYLSTDLSAEKFQDILNSIGLEVDSCERQEEIPGGLAGVVVGEVLECEMHPDSDHLHVTKVNIGQGEPLQVVCGAPNVAAGQKVLLATIGTVVSKGGEEVKMKKSKIRGVESNGMICAEDELGIGTSHEGIMVLDPAAVPGTPAKDYLHLAEDDIIEIDLTANRSDADSHYGVARDVYAYLHHNGLKGDLMLPDVSSFKEGEGEAIPVEVKAVDGAPRYMGITMKDVKVGPSPEWMQKKLKAIGLRPINNVVDITNFVMMEVGQPMHAFDAARIKGRKVVVRRAVEGEPFVTLDGVEHKLSAEDLVIANESEPMCLAGVFGGEKSGVTDSTTEVFLESAYFNPVSIRKTSKRHGIKTDASYRYERGADVNIVPYAARRAALLLEEYAGAHVVGRVQESYPEKIENKRIQLDFARMENLIGKKIGAENIIAILKDMGFEFLSHDANGAEVLAPTYRVDVYRECDVVEEVLRIYGYNNVEFPGEMRASVNAFVKPEPETVRSQVSNFLSDNGFNEIMNNSLTPESYYADCKTYPLEHCARIINPLSSDLSVMRQTLLFGGLEVIEYNINRQQSYMKLYEVGNVYFFDPQNPAGVGGLQSYREHLNLGMFITGESPKLWDDPARKSSFFELKGYLELLLHRFGIDLYNLETGAAPADMFSEGIEYSLQGRPLAYIGLVAQPLLKKFGIRQPVYAAEMNWETFFTLVKRMSVKYKELPKFPEVRRDLALLFDQGTSYAEIRRVALNTDKKCIKQVNLFDVYTGEGVPAGKKQYAISFVLQDPDQTLTDSYVENLMGRLLKAFQDKFGAVLR
jgi:phenylalanyl-tRNA synthetase beta chain